MSSVLTSSGLTPTQLRQFVRDGFVKIEHAFSPDLAAAARARLWADCGCDPRDPLTWTQPVVRLGWYADAPFAEAANSPVLRRAFDQLVGEGAWLPRDSLGTFPVRFPSRVDPGDAGWHIDPGFGAPGATDFLDWRINVQTRGRALLMLFLFSDVNRHDAPTRLRVGSHRSIARRLHPAGLAGLSLRELAADGFPSETVPAREVQATGMAGTVYLCHPFLVHAAQPHRGTRPRFMAQPPLLPATALHEAAPEAPVLLAIREALAEPPPARRRRPVPFY